MPMQTAYAPKGDYENPGASVGGVLGQLLANKLFQSRQEKENEQLMTVAKAIEDAGTREDAFTTVGNFIQNGTIKRPEQIAKFYNLINERHPPGSEASMTVYNTESGVESKVRVPKGRTITQDKDLEGIVGPGFTLAKPDIEEFYTRNPDNSVTYMGKGPIGKRPKGENVVTKSELQLTETLRNNQRLAEDSADRAVDRAQRWEETLRARREREAKAKEEARPREWEVEARAALKRRGMEINEDNMDKAVYITRRLEKAERSLLTLAGGKVKDNAVMWDNEGNQERFGRALRLLDNLMWNKDLNEYEAAEEAWRNVGGGVPRSEKLSELPPGKTNYAEGRVTNPDGTPRVSAQDVGKPGSEGVGDKVKKVLGTPERPSDQVRGGTVVAPQRGALPEAPSGPAAKREQPMPQVVKPAAGASKPGAPAAKDLPIKNGQADPEKMVDGEVYMTRNGLYKWDAKTRKLRRVD